MCDAAIAAELRLAFEDDVQHAHEWTYREWCDRGAAHKLRDAYSTAFKRWL